MIEFYQQPWFWLIIVYCILEVVSLCVIRKTWLAFLVAELFDMLHYSFTEITTRAGRERYCGMLCAGCFLLILVPFIRGVSVAVTSEHAEESISSCIVQATGAAALAIAAHWANRKFVIQK